MTRVLLLALAGAAAGLAAFERQAAPPVTAMAALGATTGILALAIVSGRKARVRALAHGGVAAVIATAAALLPSLLLRAGPGAPVDLEAAPVRVALAGVSLAAALVALRVGTARFKVDGPESPEATGGPIENRVTPSGPSRVR